MKFLPGIRALFARMIAASQGTVITPPVLITRTPQSAEDIVHPLDSHYFAFFLQSMVRVVTYANLFPAIITDIFSRCILHKTLRHSILSLSSWIVDFRLHRSMDRFQLQYIATLQNIQAAICSSQIDEGTAIAVFLILQIDMMRSDHWAARKHFRGFYLMVQNILAKTTLSPLILATWRLAIRLDWTIALYLAEEPVFPALPRGQEILQRQWITSLGYSGETVEWAIAAFALDDLMNRACHYAVQAHELRKFSDPAVEIAVKGLVTNLVEEYGEWHHLPIIQEAQMAEEAAQHLPPLPQDDPLVPAQQFLDHPPLRISNIFYANLLNAMRAISIYISLILNPSVGPVGAPQRFAMAVEMCRTLAAMEGNTVIPATSRIWTIFLIGVAFGGTKRSPREAAWLKWKMQEIRKVFPISQTSMMIYESVYDAEGDFWDEVTRVKRILKAKIVGRG